MIRFRCVRPEDASALADIYAPFVRDTAVSFEFVPPAAGEMAARIREITALYPWIVCEADGKMAGYAYASALHKRPAYGWNAELSLYLSPAFHRRGIGSALLQALLELLRMQGFQYAYACITASNDSSIRLHRRFGFEPGTTANPRRFGRCLLCPKQKPPACWSAGRRHAGNGAFRNSAKGGYHDKKSG